VNVVAVGENLPLKDESIDLVFCTGMLRHAKDPVRVIAEIRRVLIPGGTLLLRVPAIHPIMLRMTARDSSPTGCGFCFPVSLA